MQVIGDYGRTSCQVLNADKSSTFFSKNTQEELKLQVLQIMAGMKHVKKSQYFGLPMVIGRSMIAVFNYIREKITKRMHNWKKKLLSPT